MHQGTNNTKLSKDISYLDFNLPQVNEKGHYLFTYTYTSFFNFHFPYSYLVFCTLLPEGKIPFMLRRAVEIQIEVLIMEYPKAEALNRVQYTEIKEGFPGWGSLTTQKKKAEYSIKADSNC